MHVPCSKAWTRVVTLAFLFVGSEVASSEFAKGDPIEEGWGAWEHGLSYFGDFKYPPEFSNFDYANPDAPKGGTLVRSFASSFNHFTPFLAKGVSAPGVSVIGSMTLYDSLLWPSADEVGVYYGNLAERISVSDDSTKVRMRLRKEARWHDGVPVTARDIKFSFEHIRDNASLGVKSAYLSLKQVDVVSEREVMFTYHYPVNKNAMMALGKVGMLPEHYWRELDSSKTTTVPPLSSGPYRVGKFELGKFIEFERVPNYWGKDLGIHKGRHNFDKLRFDVYRDATIQREAIRKGLLDVFVETSASQWVTGYNIATREAGLLQLQEHAFKQYVGALSALAFNLTRERYQDVRVREALTLAFDLDWMNSIVHYDVYAKPQSYFHGTFLAATGLPSPDELAILEPFRDQLPERVFTEPPFAESSVAQLSGRAALIRAQTLLAEAGWQMRDGQLVDAAGEPFEIEFLVNTKALERWLLPYLEKLRQLGIAGAIRLLDTAQYLNMRRENRNEAAFGSLAISFPPNQELPAYFASSSGGFANFARLSSPVVDELIEEIMNTRNRQELASACRALDRVLWWQFYFIPVRVIETTRIVMWNKFRRPDVIAPYNSGWPDTWWRDEARADRVHQALGLDETRDD